MIHFHPHFCKFNFKVKAATATSINNLVHISRGKGHVKGPILWVAVGMGIPFSDPQTSSPGGFHTDSSTFVCNIAKLALSFDSCILLFTLRLS
jgi:hypothetical protein